LAGKYALGRIASQRNAAKTRLAKKKLVSQRRGIKMPPARGNYPSSGIAAKAAGENFIAKGERSLHRLADQSTFVLESAFVQFEHSSCVNGLMSTRRVLRRESMGGERKCSGKAEVSFWLPRCLLERPSGQ
jgi:hypothetical protein